VTAVRSYDKEYATLLSHKRYDNDHSSYFRSYIAQSQHQLKYKLTKENSGSYRLFFALELPSSYVQHVNLLEVALINPNTPPPLQSSVNSRLKTGT
jgi:hypothetical protein